jgi:transcriptional regulator with XRE-family HTH domain
MTQEEFGKKFGIVKSTVSLYESGKSTPNDQIKIKICEYFKVPLDYLLGISNEPVLVTNKNKASFLFDFKSNTAFSTLLSKRNKTKEQLSDKTGIDINILDNWFANVVPDLNQLVIVADELNTSVDYLLGRTDIYESVSNDDLEVLSYFKQLSKRDQLWIVGQMIDIAKKANREIEEDETSVAADRQLKPAK